ncbi:MAG: helix-turn-helix transcriptional regulator [Gracilimonas sp.]|jgi:AraC-like DNA-binding protein|nr:helix-turn-helix transcriptional regulator [Gracilimonas sp.]
MDYKEYQPPQEVADLIECYWTNTLHAEDFNQDHDYIIPDGSTDAIFMLNGNYLRKDERKNDKHLVEYCSLVPAFHEAVKVYQKPDTSCLVMRFKPGGFEQLTGISQKELKNPTYPLQELIPELADLAMDEAMSNKPAPDIIDKINTWVLSKKKNSNKNFLIQKFVSDCIRSRGRIIIKDFCSSMGIHKSTLEKNFKRYTGLSPKQYANLIRFNYLIRKILFSDSSLTETGYEMGYFDQSHMIKDFKKIIGISPKELLEKKFSIPKLAALSISNKEHHFKVE